MDSNLQDQTPELKTLTIQVLREITGDFCNDRKLGQGGYGKVYKGVHGNGKEIAVKLLFDKLEHDDEAFEHEFDNIMKLNHPNIIRLVGYCYDTERQHMEYEGKTIFGERTYRALCFEFMPNGSLKKHLSEEHDGLDWCTRYKIIKGTCEGLKYLHKDLKKPIYHLDLKPDNILLDKHMVPKLADFGLSQIFDQEQSMITQNRPGTFGYMPPELIWKDQVISNKVDIFSLGVVMIDIIVGPKGRSKSVEMPFDEFIYLVNKNWGDRFRVTWSTTPLEALCKQVITCTKIALRCIESNRHKRPSIEEIIHTLNETETVINQLNIDEGSLTDKGFYTMEQAILTMRVLRDITNNFSEDQLIGEGSHGKVYRGIKNGEEIAVKLLHNSMKGVDDEQFRHEAETYIRLKHPNIVLLVGYCCETEVKPMTFDGRIVFADMTHRAICFEYMQNGSLQTHLYDELEGFDWQTRYKIIKGTCEGLKYLHEGLHEPIYHLNLYPNNILLDKDMNPKVADFTLSSLFGRESTMRTVQPSSIGYLPPEYIHIGLASKKLDIFSLGVVMTNIIAGPNARYRRAEMSDQEFLDQVLGNWRKRLQATWSSPEPLQAHWQQVKRCTEIALRCMEIKVHKRPSIVVIIDELNETEAAIDKKGFYTKEQEILTMRVLRDITNNFSEDQLIGEGSHGKVYRGIKNGEDIAAKLFRNPMAVLRGVHDNGKEIAVKLLFDKLEHDDEAFKYKFDNLMKLNHPNIIRLVGYCYDTERQPMEYEGKIIFRERTYRALCFEFMPNGSLKKHLSDELEGFDWKTRYKIIKGTCKGLKYLHEGLHEPIYHLDLKPNNILLDKDMNPKVADFTQQIPLEPIIYIPPEYIKENVVSKKHDIFSLGAVMTNIIAGPNARYRRAEMSDKEFLDQVLGNWRKRLQATWSSPEPLETHWQQVKRCTEIALSCLEIDRHKRPSIVDIIEELNETEAAIDKDLLGETTPHKDKLELDALLSRLEAVQELLKEKELELDQLRLELNRQQKVGEDLRQLLESKTREVEDLEKRVKMLELDRNHVEMKESNLVEKYRIEAHVVEAEKKLERVGGEL